MHKGALQTSTLVLGHKIYLLVCKQGTGLINSCWKSCRHFGSSTKYSACDLSY